ETDTAGTESDTGSETDTESDTGVDPNVPTYFGDVLPIFAEACENCHADGGIAPFVTNRYEDVVPWGPAIAAAVTARTMPPFLVDNSGTCETFEHARWLSDDEVATIEAWVDADMPEGTLVGEAPSPPPPNDLVGEEIVTVSTPAYTPTPKGTSDALYDDYRCFAVEIGNTETKFLQGFEIEPGNAEIVHHVVGFKVDPNRKVIGDITNAGIMELLDGKDDEPGWECFGAAGENVLLEGVPITWAPGVTAINYPEGTGIRFEPGEILVVQMHYYLANSGGEDATGLRLSLADSVDREGYLGIYDEFLFDGLSGGSAELEPGKESVVYAWDAALSSFVGDAGGAEEVEVLGILPHMHRRGQRMQVSYQTESSGEDADCGAYIANWDFDWQQLFFYNEPPVLKPSDRIAVTCEWNTEGAANAIEPGFGSDNEMCLIGVYVAPKKP
ncbi:MAG: hypothetical protein ACPG4T_16690, partial [Nannocystaceae bacterium]